MWVEMHNSEVTVERVEIQQADGGTRVVLI